MNTKSAIAYNEKNCKRLGWYGNLPAEAVQRFPSLASDPLGSECEQRDFAEAVFDLQGLVGAKQDGKLGSGTLGAVREYFDIKPKRGYITKGVRIPAPNHENSCDVITFQDPGGLSLEESGKYARKGRETRFLLGHWSAIQTVSGTHGSLLRSGYSVHHLVGLVDGKPCIFNTLDSDRFGVHAGVGKKTREKHPSAISGNIGTEAFDICSTPVKSAFKSLSRRGHRIHIVENTTGRGDDEIVTLDPRLERATAELMVDRLVMLGLPIQWPVSAHRMGQGTPYHGVISKELWEAGRGFLVHSNLHPGKWDFACWLEGILTHVKDIIGGS